MNDEIFQKKYAGLNARQREAVDTVYGPVMVVAGPGTGKTTVLSLRIANILLKTGARPEEILALTFTDSGAKAMREKLREVVGDVSFRVNLFTFHSFANYMRSMYPEYFEKIGGRQPGSQIDTMEAIEEILTEKSFREIRPSTFGVKVRDIAKRISDLKREAIDPDRLHLLVVSAECVHREWKESLQKTTKTLEAEIERKEKYFRRLFELEEIYRDYETKLEEKKIYDFDDTILGLIDALAKHPDMILEMRENFQYVLADEHQDANGAQNQILRFFKGIEGAEDDLANIFVVGDDKQSIFRFQGASLESFYNFSEEFPGAKRIDLKENYRSQPHVLGIAHGLIMHDGRNHTELSAETEHPAKPVEVIEFETAADELSATAAAIKKELEENPDGTIAVISRTNGALFELARYLDAEGISYALAGERSLFESFEYKKLLFLFKALINPLSNDALARSFHFGYFKMNLRDLLALQNKARDERRSFGDVLLSGAFDQAGISDIQALDAAKAQIEELAESARKTGLLPFLKKLAESIALADNHEGYEVLKELFEEAGRLVLRKRQAELSDLVSHLELLDEHGLSLVIGEKEKKSAVTLMSIHKSKGLEFDTVHIIDVTDKKFEKSGRKNDLLRIPGIGIDKDLEEDRRLLYVAITRARKHACISYSLSGLENQSTVPSILIDELDPKYTDKKAAEKEIPKPDLLAPNPEEAEGVQEMLRAEFLKRPFSVTALNNYLECPWKYVIKNLLLIPEAPEYSSMLGTACHEALREFHLKERKGERVSEEELKRIAARCVHMQPFSKSELVVALEKAEENVLAYHRGFVPFSPDEKVHVEASLSAPFEAGEEGAKFEVLLTGKIDLAIEEGGRVWVKDFKSRKRVTRNEILGETKSSDGNLIRQLRFYKFLWEKARAEDIVRKASLVFLSPERGKIAEESFELGGEDIEEIEKTTREALVSIFNFSFWNTNCDKKDCEYCIWADSIKARKK